MDKVTPDNNTPASWAGNAGASCSADSADQSEFANAFNQEAQKSSDAGQLVCTDPTAPTPREEAMQQSLPENERYLPPPSPQKSSKPATSSSASSSQTAPPQWELGPRGEHIPTNDWTGGPLRPIQDYDKPWAIALAKQGDYEAAELAQNYLCASCHILTKVDPHDFNLRGYVKGWQRNYIQGMVEVPLKATPIGAAWEVGVSTGQAITGEGSGLHISNISSALVDDQTDLGKKLTTGERLWEGGTAAVGWATMGLGLRAPAPAVRGAMIGEGYIATRPISAGSAARLNGALANRMQALGIPEENIGIPQYGGQAYHAGGNTVGGNIQGVGINVDSGVLQPIEGWEAWNNAPLSVRADAVIAHEWAEFNGATHAEALQLAPNTSLPIRPESRALLLDMLRLYGQP